MRTLRIFFIILFQVVWYVCANYFQVKRETIKLPDIIYLSKAKGNICRQTLKQPSYEITKQPRFNHLYLIQNENKNVVNTIFLRTVTQYQVCELYCS